MSDPHLINVAQQVKKLEREISDAEWDSDPRLEALVRELNHFKDLQDRGVLYEPNF